MSKSLELYQKAKTFIPGGTQLLSKRPEMFLPEHWPAYYDKSKGCDVWDLDGNRYTDMSLMGIGACVIGYSDDDVNSAVKIAIDKGSMNTLNAPEEVELAELLCEIHPWADMVRYARTGGEALSISVRIARAKSKKDTVLFCGYHGWHDWYLAANLSEEQALDGHLLSGLDPLGVPRNLKGTIYPFSYNNTDEFLSLIDEHKDKVGVVVMEPIRNIDPDKKFLKTIRKITKELGIILVVDEVTAAWRMNLGGAHLILDFEPDIAVFGKATSNGFPMAAIIGKKQVMEAAQDSFISSTYWTDRTGPSAAIATIKKFKEKQVHKHLISVGAKIQDIWKKSANECGIDIHVSGIAPLGHFSFEYEKPLVLKTLFTQLMLDRGFLATTAFYASYAHKEKHIEDYANAVLESFKIIKEAILSKDSESYLKGPVCHAGFKRLT